MDRRGFIKIAITGSLAAIACPRGRDSGGRDPVAGPALPPRLSAESHAACHAVRDGAEIRLPRPSRHLPIVIVGAGPAGLTAARVLGDRPYLLIEKEPQVGGNATGGSWRGVGFSSGVSYGNDDDLKALAAEMGVPLLPIDSVDGLIVRDIYVPEFLTKGVTRAPYPQAVRDAFRRFVDTYRHYDVDADRERLDNLPFLEILKNYPVEVGAFFDSFGPNNWGARVRDTSAYVGIQAASWMGGLEPRRYTGEEGFGALTRALGSSVAAGGPDRLLLGAAVVRVQRDGERVLVAYVPPGSADAFAEAAVGAGAGAAASILECVSADAVIVAAPKLIARRIVAGLPSDQQEAMAGIRYAPYMVANFCFDGVVHEDSFDTNVPAPDVMSDFVCADWIHRRGRGPKDRPTVLSCYMPQDEADRAVLLDEVEVRSLVLKALDASIDGFRGRRASAPRSRCACGATRCISRLAAC